LYADPSASLGGGEASIAVATSTELQWALIWLNQRSPGEFPAALAEEVFGGVFTEASVSEVSTWEVKTRAQRAI
jgi:hypothetical protein